MLFIKNKIRQDEYLVAEKLRAARIEQNLSLPDIAQKLGIRADYLEALENGNYEKIPTGVYEKTFLKKYAAFLGLNALKLAEKYQKERIGKSKENPDVFAKKRIRSSELLIFPKILKNILIVFFIAALFLYLGYYLKTSFSQPMVEILQPPDNLVTENNFVDIIGKADPKTQITINNKQILKDETGNFRETVELKKGINTITISAQNKYSRKKIIQKQILVK
jgi:transcriptional regulator with XRE-family HTH domain